MKKALFILALVAASLAKTVPASAVSYRGMVDFAPAIERPHRFEFYNGSFTDWGRYKERVTLSVSTTHGLQLSKKHFLGLGFEYNQMLLSKYLYPDQKVGIPLYAMWRMDFFGRKWAPFFDLRGGYQLGKASGLYAAANVGVRMVINRHMGLNFSVGARARRIYYTLHSYISTVPDYDVNTDCYGLTFRIGIDF